MPVYIVTSDHFILTHQHTGQFWNTPIAVEAFGDKPGNYTITIAGNQPRQLVGSIHKFTWQLERKQCLYVGDRQGAKGAGRHGGPNDPVIEGVYMDYMTEDPFGIDLKYSLFEDND